MWCVCVCVNLTAAPLHPAVNEEDGPGSVLARACGFFSFPPTPLPTHQMVHAGRTQHARPPRQRVVIVISGDPHKSPPRHAP